VQRRFTAGTNQPVLTQPAAPATPSSSASLSNPVPTLAYYYIWFDPSSWDHAKIDTPLLGRYSSDDRSVMLQQVQWQKQPGSRGLLSVGRVRMCSTAAGTIDRSGGAGKFQAGLDL